MAIQSTPSREELERQYENDNMAAYTAAMSKVDGTWKFNFIDDPTIPDEVKIAAADLMAELVRALTQCRTESDVQDLRRSFTSAHTLASHPELVALVSVASKLSPADQAALVQTVARVADGRLDLRPDGTVQRPRQGQPSVPAPAPTTPAPAPTSPSPAPTTSAPTAPAPTSPPPTNPAPTPAPASPATPAPTPAPASPATPAPARPAPRGPRKWFGGGQ